MQADIIILGAGIAGCSAAAQLARTGFNVLLVQAPSQKTPRYRVGESLPGAALRMLRHLGIHHLNELLSEGQYRPSAGNMTSWRGSDWQYRDAIQDPEGAGWHLDRAAFDEALLNYAIAQGATLIEAEIQELAHNGAVYRLSGISSADQSYQLEAPWIIDATGKQGWLVRRLAGNPQRLSDQWALVCWMNAHPEDEDDITRLISEQKRSRLESVKPHHAKTHRSKPTLGWWYSARLPDNKRVLAFHGSAAEVAEGYRDLPKWLTSAKASGVLPEGYENLSEAQIVAVKSCDASVQLSPSVAGKGWLAVGDAALSFDPLSSQGMFFALYSGIRGAEAISQSLNTPAFAKAAMGEYADKVGKVLASNQRARSLFYGDSPAEKPLSAHPHAQQSA
ncbi:NAD(P)/FAD-dependent oxidoreductase [Pokkaliibacter sp. CJK22405]|uniref:NAD(P)/FAD-dependent oxidoreductase n=1 Tax=Pokkaliibacter sp. CJK22405 TaxID=3384615 RepID=UPI003984D10A